MFLYTSISINNYFNHKNNQNFPSDEKKQNYLKYVIIIILLFIYYYYYYYYYYLMTYFCYVKYVTTALIKEAR